MRSSYSNDDLKLAIDNSISLAGVLKFLQLDISGGNYKTLKTRIKSSGFDTSHFKGQAHQAGRVYGSKRKIEDYLTNKFKIGTHGLKLRLIKDGYLKHQCSICGITEWMGKPTPIQLDHIDGNNENNNLSNLRILCPNCHAQTDTYCGKNIK